MWLARLGSGQCGGRVWKVDRGVKAVNGGQTDARAIAWEEWV